MGKLDSQQLAKIRTMVPEMRRVERIHFVGIGGAGMSGIAEVLVNEGTRSAVLTWVKMR